MRLESRSEATRSSWTTIQRLERPLSCNPSTISLSVVFSLFIICLRQLKQKNQCLPTSVSYPLHCSASSIISHWRTSSFPFRKEDMSNAASSKNIVEDVDDVVFIPKSKRSDLGIGVKRVFRPVDVTAPVSPSPPPDPLLAANSISSRTVTAPAPQQSSVKPQTNNLVATATPEPSAGKGVVVVSQSYGQQNQQQPQHPDRDLMDELKMKHRSRHEYYLESKETLTNALAEVHTGRDGAMRLANMNPQGRGRGRGGRGRGQSGPHRRY